jgi:hypothetical protein
VSASRCVPEGQLLVGLADSQRWHLPITAATFVTAAAARATMATAQGFSAHLLLVVVAEACHVGAAVVCMLRGMASMPRSPYANMPSRESCLCVCPRNLCAVTACRRLSAS